MTGASHNQSTSARRRLGAALLLGLGAAVFAVQVGAVWPFTADDAFITFRYAANWAAGEGPNWNAGGGRAEGFSSFGFVLIALIPELLHLDPVIFTKVLGLGCVVGAAGLAGRIAQELEGATSDLQGSQAASPLAGAFAAMLVLGYYPTAVHAVSGMETSLAALLLTALILQHIRRWRERPSPRFAVGALSLAVGLVRPELNLVVLALLALSLAQARGVGRRRLAREAGLYYALPGALYFAARSLYYGHLLPLPFYAKITGGEALPGAGSVLAFGESALGLVGLLAALPLLLAPRLAGRLAAILVLLVALALLPDPVMDFDFRYCFPAVPALFALGGAGFACLLSAVETLAQRSSSNRLKRTARPGLALAALLSLAAASAGPATSALRERRAYGDALQTMNVRFGHTLRDLAAASGRTPTVALGDVGAIGYYSGARVLDTFSLNEPAIILGGRDDPGYILSQDPDVVAVVSTHPREFRPHWANSHDPALYAACVREGRRPAVVLTFSAASFLWVMTRPGSAVETSLRHTYLGPPGANRADPTKP